MCKYFAKGQQAAVSGRLQIREWKDKEGNNRRSAEVVVDNVYFADSKRSGAGSASGAAYINSTQASYAAPSEDSEFAELDDDGELPF